MARTMRFRSVLLIWLCVCLAAVGAPPLRALPVATRASQLRGVAAGMGKLLHMADYLKEYPGSRTAILSYFKMDSMDVRALIGDMRVQAAIQASLNADFAPQIALETDHLSLTAFRRELSHSGSPLDRSVRLLASEIARYRPQNKWFFIRPFSEMNDATWNTPWEFGNPVHRNTPADLAAAWMLLRRVFDQEGATNALFVFSPLAANGVHRQSEVLSALNLIPAGGIDAFSLNLYSRPPSAYGGKGAEPIPFAALAQPWLNVLARSRHRGIPLAIAEMGVSSQASDTQRTKWLRAAFQFGRAHGFIMMTYFNFPHRYWEIHDGTQAGIALKEEINRGLANPGVSNSEEIGGASLSVPVCRDLCSFRPRASLPLQQYFRRLP